ncbi:Chitotriosidase-1 OS=Homo sapiens GN=CHIT1 PE=1 SV=1 [Rhizoctonia solani AG-1 IB]|uniref:Chitotriosidase-1 n=1 Tax=Thanatephorus cucumeris (strain AG1-IB / isolate 7/3/14) TaxID=1108050 RepID=A0A0B7FUC0_THACB|nr:Chitotriosidase-1 OS=Homo sapiens GN=CHIT1 PE=1 SV=1 [Rhizoctonia solani AG-1 IB]
MDPSAFALIDDSNHITPARSSDTDLYRQVMKLKDSNPDLKIFISVGGWAFNDPGPSQRRFSIVASSSQNRAAFISSSLQFMKTYGFDGIDIDWEYPVDSLRGGVAEDKSNFNLLMKEFRAAIRSSGTPYGLTLTTPSSYYYLRHFDVEELAKWIDWFNHMTYDLHGVWDRDSVWLGPYVNSHSNLTEIDISLDLFWRNKIPASKVSIGLGFYGRSFQLQSSSCTSPGCLFTGPANKGECTGEAGILSFSEIQRAIGSTSLTRKRAATVKWDKTAAVKYATWDDQWISYDDEDTFKQKIDYANKLGLGGMLIWAADQDDGDYSAMNAISKNVGINNLKLSIKSDGDKSKRDIKSLKDTCVSTDCSEDPRCDSGYTPISVRSKPDKLTAKCKKGLKQLICCPSNSQPQSCRWAGEAPNCRNENQCTAGEEELARDSSGDGAKCLQSAKTLCCTPPKPVVDALKQCKWFGTSPSCGGDGLCADPGYPVQVTTGVGLGGNGNYNASTFG